MPKIAFDYNGREYKAEVPESFLALTPASQSQQLTTFLEKEYGYKPTPPKEDKNILDYLALIERPAQALKVGIRETELGSDISRLFGVEDLTPGEGFLTGAKRGWLGQDEVRTQDYLPENMNPIAKGILGFVGDVATDPVTWFGPQAVVKAGSSIKKASDTAGLTDKIVKTRDAVLKTSVPGMGDRKFADVARYFNVQTGKGKAVKGKATAATVNAFTRAVSDFREYKVQDLNNMLKAVAERNNVGADEVDAMLARALETKVRTETKMRKVKGEDGKLTEEPIPMRDSDGNIIYDEITKQPVPDIRPVRDEFGSKVYEDFSPEVKAFFQPEELDEVVSIRELTDEALLADRASGLGIREKIVEGYMPRVLTEEGREALKVLENIEDVIYGSDAVFNERIFKGASYAKQRMLKGNFAEANKYITKEVNKRLVALGRPAMQDSFFVKAPVQALSARLTAQERRIAKATALDDITDAASMTGWFSAGKANPVWKGESGIGIHVRNATDGKDKWQEVRKINPKYESGEDLTNRYIWERIDSDDFARDIAENNLVRVKSVPEDHMRLKEADDEWARTLDEGIKELGYPTLVDDAFQNNVRTRADFLRFAGTQIPGLDKDVKTLSAMERMLDKADEAKKLFIEQHPGSFFYAEDTVARQINETLEILSGQSNKLKMAEPINNFVKHYDEWINAWKSWSLGVRPAYHTRNVIGNVWNMWMIAGYSPKAYAQMIQDAGKLQYYARFGGNELRRQQTLKNVEGALGKGMKLSSQMYKKIDDAAYEAPNYAGTGLSMRQIYERARENGVTAGHYSADIIRDAETAARIQAGRGTFFEKFVGKDNPVVKAGFAFGGTIEGNARLALFMHTLKQAKKNPNKHWFVADDGKRYRPNAVPGLAKGEKPQYFKRVFMGREAQNVPLTADDVYAKVAADEVKRVLFDYNDLSKFEQVVMKRIAPFYTWTRKNMPAQFSALIQNPQRAEQLAIMKQQFEHESGDMSKVDFGEFWNDRVPVFFGNESKGVIQAFTLMNLLPMADLQYTLNPMRLFGEMVSPGIKAPIEQLMNYNSFTAKQIDQGTGNKDFLGVSLPPRLHYLAEMLVPLAEINKVNPANIFGANVVDPATGKPVVKYPSIFGVDRETYKDKTWEQRLIRFFSGVPVHDVNLKQTKYFENKLLMQDIAKLKGMIKIAANKGENRKLKALHDMLEAVMTGQTTDPFNTR